MSPLFFALLGLLAAVFFYAIRRTLRQPTLNLPPLPDAAQEDEYDASESEAGAARTASGEPAGHDPAPSDRSRTRAANAPGSRTPLDTGWGRQPAGTGARAQHPAPSPGHARRPLQTTAPMHGKQRPSRAHRMFGSRADLRRAVVAMTVLGPCRALDPYTPDQRAPHFRD